MDVADNANSDHQGHRLAVQARRLTKVGRPRFAPGLEALVSSGYGDFAPCERQREARYPLVLFELTDL